MANQLSADLVVVGDIKTIAGGQLSRTAVLPVTYQNKAAPAVGPTIPAGATLTGISVISDLSPSRLYSSEWHKRSQGGYRPAIGRS